MQKAAAKPMKVINDISIEDVSKLLSGAQTTLLLAELMAQDKRDHPPLKDESQAP